MESPSSETPRRSILDILDAQLDAVEAGLASARATITMMREQQQQAALRSQQTTRQPPRTFGMRSPSSETEAGT